ncbi:ABC transporter substrate-binding protein [Actinokineospora sp. NBRC 105648]|uniref:ABC transporter substrate-binding protein n=1 Tax=Actinokineospora sp. NBRC 105648 TaxID=3032206 RepID=UPI00249FA3AC|nr:ABC transporter substrate-binding protein [Actinokineospora sp. NBRC 105648]GLZ39731.1 sulfonate ABC transporter substrate-binding protein [Actinokineospora sp. NBRC 105648]
MPTKRSLPQTVLLVLAAILGAAALTACGPSTSDSSGQVVLRVGDQTGATQSRLRAAGLLDGLPYKIEWSQFAAAVNLHEALRANAVDIGGASDSPTVTAIANGSKIRVAAAWTNGGRGTYLLVPKDSPAKTVADLKGKRISPTTKGSVAHYLVIGELTKAGLTDKDVTLNFLAPTEANAAFSTGQIDAWATWSVYAVRARTEQGARVLSDGTGVNTGLNVLSATDSALADKGKRDAITDFTRRLDKSYAWSRDNPEAFEKWYAEFAHQPREIAAQVRPDETAYQRVPVDGELAGKLQKTYDTWVRQGLFPGGKDLKQYVDTGFDTP